MRVRRISIANVRSFLETAELALDGSMNILVGPNGGGKTNLLDTLFSTLRRHIFTSVHIRTEVGADGADRYVLQQNDLLNDLKFEPHAAAPEGSDQKVVLDLEVTQIDIENMSAMQVDAPALSEFALGRFENAQLGASSQWDLSQLSAGDTFVYEVTNNGIRPQGGGQQALWFLTYLQCFDTDALLRDQSGRGRLSLPLLYLPVSRSQQRLHSKMDLANSDQFDTRRVVDVATSRQSVNVFGLALNTLADRYVRLREDNNVLARSAFDADPQVKALTSVFATLGYQWNLKCTNARTNRFDVELTKQGTSFSIDAASSGERELINFLFAIYALNVRDALVIIDEPELHLHPKWQRALLSVFAHLAKQTGNQFVLATHSPTFVSPESIQFVSRVYSDKQRSRVVRLDSQHLPNEKHLLSIVNSQNNERVFFADAVVLCEGISDRIFFEAVLDRFGRQKRDRIIEVISVGGKGVFSSYEKILTAAGIPYWVIADRDYVEQVGSSAVKALFALDVKEIKKDVVDNIKSMDGEQLVRDIETALETGSWEHAQGTWSYIKSRRRMLEAELSADDQVIFDEFLLEQAAQRIHILRKGAIERYLPVGYAGKDVEKLVLLLKQSNFWDQLPVDGCVELAQIAKAILDQDGPQHSGAAEARAGTASASTTAADNKGGWEEAAVESVG